MNWQHLARTLREAQPRKPDERDLWLKIVNMIAADISHLVDPKQFRTACDA